jgi:hypothetical protein
MSLDVLKNVLLSLNQRKRLLEICSQSQLRIANGRSFGDLTGEFTSHSTLGSSVIDYFVISEAILGKLLFMKVHNFMKSLSDHCLISCVLSVNFTETHYKGIKIIPIFHSIGEVFWGYM